MSSRQQEKERRRKEREEREAAAAARARRSRLIQLIGGVVVACAIIAGVAYAVSSGGGDDDGGGIDDGKLKQAATASGCVYRAFPNEGQDHVTKKLTAADYKTNPPTSGDHLPPGQEAPDGVYAPGNEPGIGNWVHTLEHGRILFQYRPGVDKSVVARLNRLFNENVAGSGGAYHSVLMQNNSKMPFQVAAVAWRHYMACREFTRKSIDALRVFRGELVDTAPEKVP
jgi:hypothetical protein